ncbi:hypothetical protein [Pseudobacillus wudalianchiensis]|uniref:Uncharacterized protein n=1 Tax=Pseudobacillus wudalianchiensis TaxID=1743143 RepID=A0A1B9AE32_9BACI|nr:hypothetical protein [Bacillus wudalianchiensis]OCA82088.1 hypothetical protein A8F95_15425 [Bacillus wudalianchiensis]
MKELVEAGHRSICIAQEIPMKLKVEKKPGKLPALKNIVGNFILTNVSRLIGTILGSGLGVVSANYAVL